MESTNESKIIGRTEALSHWLRAVLGHQFVGMMPLAGDASFRRYFRITTATDTFVAMDAPPPEETCRPFIAIARVLRQMNLQAPDVINANEENGFLLLTDFGDQTYLSALTQHNADQYYDRALSALAALQSCRSVPDLTVPPFTYQFMQQEWSWHKEWFLEKLLNLQASPALDDCFNLVAESATLQPQVFMHRDYHSANLMVLPHDVGILDFQDAFIGPVTYDLVSLLRDCYIDWPDKKVNQWVNLYLQKLQSRNELLSVDEQTFMRWFDLMGIERHLKALFTFSRKYLRDQQAQYLRHIPRTLNYVIKVSERYPALAPLHSFMCDHVQPTTKKVLACAR